MFLGLDIEVEVVVTCLRELSLEEALVRPLQRLWHHGQLLVLLELGYLTILLHAAEGKRGIGWMQQDFNDVNFLTIGVEHLLSSLLGQLG